MFIINKDGTSAIEVKQIDMRIKHDEALEERAKEMYRELMQEVLHNNIFITIEEGRKNVKKIVRQYVKEHAIYTIFINNEYCIGDYGKLQGEVIFKKILTGLDNGENIFDMREIRV